MAIQDALDAVTAVRQALDQIEAALHEADSLVELLRSPEPPAVPPEAPAPVDPIGPPAYNPGAAEAPQ